MDRDQVVTGYMDELRTFVALLRSLDERDWRAPTRCTGWTVADVAAHVTGTLTDITSGRIENQGTPETTARQVQERRGRSAADVADELEAATKAGADMLALFDDDAWAKPSPGGYDWTLGFAVESLWYDTFVHAEDIRSAIGRPSERGGVEVSVRHVAELLPDRGFGSATLELDGLEPIQVGSGGRRITGDPLAFVLAASGRGDPSAFGCDETLNIYRG